MSPVAANEIPQSENPEEEAENLAPDANEAPTTPASEPVADASVSEAPEAETSSENTEAPPAPVNSDDDSATAAEATEDTSADGGDEDEIDEYEEDDDEDDSESAVDESASGLKRGSLADGVVLKTSPTEILVDLGEHGEGVINSRELERLTSATLETLVEGSKILTYVLNASNADGKAVLSISRALEESDWRTAEEYLESADIYDGKVSGYNKGGLIVRFGRLRGFVPASQISSERRDRAKGNSPEERWGTMLGEPIHAKVVELKRSRNRLILSEQAAMREMREKKKSELLDSLQVGQIRKGYVTSLTEFGAFVDLGGADGLVHLTELSWTHVTHPSEVVQIGQEVEVEVISVDIKDRRIGLSMRRLGHDPWDEIASQYERGQLIQASVTKLTKFGAFARLVEHPEIEGLVHVSELSEHRVRHPREVVSKGDVLTLRIIKIDKEQRRLGLSLKQVDSPEFMDFDWRMTDDN